MGGTDRFAMAAEGQTQRFAQVLEKMPAVGDLRCIGSTATGAVSINASAIASDDFDARMTFQPSRDRVGISVRQQIEDAVAFQIADDRSVALPLAPGPVDDADHPRRVRRLEPGCADHPQQRVAAYRHGEFARQARAGFTADREADHQLALAEAGGASRFRLHRFRQPFRKDPLMALRIGATEPPGVKPDFDNPSLPRQISHPAHVVTVDAAGSAAAGGTARFCRLRPGYKHHLVGLWENLDNRKLGGDQRAEGMEHGRITGVDCDSDSMDSFAPPVNPGTCTKYAEDPKQGETHLDCRRARFAPWRRRPC